MPAVILVAAIAVTATAGEVLATAPPRSAGADRPQRSAAIGSLAHRSTGERAADPTSHGTPAKAEVPRPQPHPRRSPSASPRRARSLPALPHVVPARVAPAGPTRWPALNLAIARIPGSRAELARWVVTSRYGSWGTADWYEGTIYISPGVPQSKLYSVAVHEWSHLLSVRPYAGNVNAAVAAMNRVFGGHGLTGAERAADCMALLLGAHWTHYTTCRADSWRLAAHVLLSGGQL
jgi:hypothetical protein